LPLIAPEPRSGTHQTPQDAWDGAPAMQQIADWLENLGLGQAGYSRGEGQKLVSKAYKNNWNAIYSKKKKKKKKR
jgi:hypothetical protein